jgi:hypothetical protein
MDDLLHMDAGSRNRRLYEKLAKTGLYVMPVFAEDDTDRIDYLHVSASLPAGVQQPAQESTSLGIAKPVPRAKIGIEPEAAEGGGNRVVNFPSVVGVPPVSEAPDDTAIAVDSIPRSSRDLLGLAKDVVKFAVSVVRHVTTPSPKSALSR